MIGVVDVGGGLRGAFGAGVFDYCLDNGIRFPFCVGVSAGSANLCSYLAGQKGRNIPFYTEYPRRKAYMGLGNLLFRRSYIDLDYVYGTLSNEGGENPLDYDALQVNPARLEIVATDAETGQPVYFDKTQIRRNAYDALKASSCLPGICHAYKIAGHPYYDGGISDPIPVARALCAGCDRVVVVLTRPKDYVRTQGNDKYFARMIRRYPKAAEAVLCRYETYNRQLVQARRLEREGICCILAPDDISGIGTLSTDPGPILALYQKGYEAAKRLEQFL